MTAPNSDTIDITIDIFDAGRQRARVLRTLTAGELIAEILREFDDLDRDTPEGYSLYVKERPNPLVAGLSLIEQDVQTYDELELRYARAASGKMRLKTTDRAYLVEMSRPQLYPLRWNPAVIGRSTADPAHNARLSIDLKDLQDSGYISRAHAQVGFAGGQYFVESLSESNPTFLNDGSQPVKGRQPLHDGDRIILSRERVILCFTCLKPGEFDPEIPLAAVQVRSGASTRILPLTQVPFRIPLFDTESETVITYTAETDTFTLEQPAGAVKADLAAGNPIPLAATEVILLR